VSIVVRTAGAPRGCARRIAGVSGTPKIAMVIVATLAAGLTLGLILAARPATAASPCGAPVPGQARVVVVIDDGEGGADHAVATCVVVPKGTTGSQLLARRAALVGAAAPTHAGSGLLCTIDSFPVSQCAETASGSYWANYAGVDGSWNYSSYNPFIRRVCDGDVEGWRYVVGGSGAAGDAQPRLDPATVRPVDAWGCSEPPLDPGAGGAQSASDPTTDGIAGSGAEGTDSASADTGPTNTGRSALADPNSSPEVASSGAADDTATGRSGSAAGAAVTAADVAGSATAAPSSAGTTSSWGAGFAVSLIVVLGAAALLRSRRRA